MGCKPFHEDSAKTIGVESNGVIVGAFMFEDFRGNSVQIHAVGIGQWMTRGLFGSVFRYCFDQLKVKKVIAMLDESNKDSVRLCEHAGFICEATVKDGGRNGDMLIYTITRQQCRHPTRSNHARRIIS